MPYIDFEIRSSVFFSVKRKKCPDLVTLLTGVGGMRRRKRRTREDRTGVAEEIRQTWVRARGENCACETSPPVPNFCSLTTLLLSFPFPRFSAQDIFPTRSILPPVATPSTPSTTTAECTIGPSIRSDLLFSSARLDTDPRDTGPVVMAATSTRTHPADTDRLDLARMAATSTPMRRLALLGSRRIG